MRGKFAMSLRGLLFTAGALACLSGAVAFYSLPASAESPPLVLAQNDEDTGFWGRVFNRSDRNQSAKPLFLDRSNNVSPSGHGTPYNYGSQGTNQDRNSSFTSNKDALKMRQERDSAVQKRTDNLLKMAALKNEKRSAALEKSILETNASAAGRGAGTGNDKDGKVKMVYDPQKAKNYNPNPAPYTTRSTGRDPEENQSAAPTGRLYNTR